MKRAHILLAGAAIAALVVFPATAQSSYSGAQVQLDDSFAGLSIEVDDADSVGGAAVAGGNSFSAASTHAGFSVDAAQYSEGRTDARADAQVWRAWDAVVIDATAANNGVTGSAQNGSMDIATGQEADGDTSARAQVTTGSAWVASSSASAGANVIALDAENGDITLNATQNARGNIEASVEADHCCVSTQTIASTIAGANTISASGSTTTMLAAANQISNGASVQARTDLYVGYAGDANGSAAASGNALTVANEWGYVNVAATQANASAVTAESYVTLGGDWLGYAAASAYGVGNAAAVSNIGSDTVIVTDQTNTGFVGSYAALAGDGAYGAVSSTAYGNLVTGGLCSTCSSEPSLTAANYQSNSGRVESVATIRSGRAGAVMGSAAAIGNAASYSNSGN